MAFLPDLFQITVRCIYAYVCMYVRTYRFLNGTVSFRFLIAILLYPSLSFSASFCRFNLRFLLRDGTIKYYEQWSSKHRELICS
jgi:hypothetical protein